MSTATQARTLARPAGFLGDMATVASRAIRSVLRDPETVIPGLVIGAFFYGVNIGALQDFAETIPGLDYRAFTLPIAILFAITGLSRAMTLVTDIQTGYFDRLSLTPVNRLPLLLGLMVADLALVIALTLPVLALGLVTGVRFASGPVGMLAFIGLSGLWGVAYTGFPYAIALKTGNPAAVNTSFLLFLPFMFFTTAFLPIEVLTGWMATIATYNPVTYLLSALRSLVSEGWNVVELGKGLIAIAAVWAVSHTLALAALRGRVRRR
jgi:ABC-2 type transport system permease protein